MKHRIIAIALALVIVLSSALVTGAANGWFTNMWKENPNGTGVIKYEKPTIGELTLDGAYPEEIESEISDEDWNKPWYEYITYSQKPMSEHQKGNHKWVFYDPYDYNYGMVTEITGTAYDGLLDEEGYTTANSINVSYTTEASLSVSQGISTSITTGLEISGGAVFAEAKTAFSCTLGVTMDMSVSTSSSQSKSVEYNAIYFNSYGAPYRWRVVKYAVFIPIYCEYQKLVNGQWVVAASGYCLVATVQGTCREWIQDGVAYYEDWKTGEPIAVEDFWKEYLTKEKLVSMYVNGGTLLPAQTKSVLSPSVSNEG